MQTQDQIQAEIESIETEIAQAKKQLPALTAASAEAERQLAAKVQIPVAADYVAPDFKGGIAARQLKTAPEGMALAAAQAQIGQLNIRLQEARAAQLQAQRDDERGQEIAELSGKIAGTEAVSRYELLMMLLDQRDENKESPQQATGYFKESVTLAEQFVK